MLCIEFLWLTVDVYFLFFVLPLISPCLNFVGGSLNWSADDNIHATKEHQTNKNWDSNVFFQHSFFYLLFFSAPPFYVKTQAIVFKSFFNEAAGRERPPPPSLICPSM
jgi:hypothetical protein